jgi:hypothetical protein
VPCLVASNDWRNSSTDPQIGCDGATFVQHVSAAANTPACAKNASVAGTLLVVLSGPYENTALGCSSGTTAGQTTLNSSTVFVNTLGIGLFNVFAHEIGHALGLTHNSGNTTALMFPTAGSSTGLDATDCATARARALQIQSAYQGW